MQRRFIAYFCTLFLALSAAWPTYGRTTWISPDGSITERECTPDDVIRGRMCGAVHRALFAEYLEKSCFFLDGQDRVVTKFTSVDFSANRYFPDLIGNLLFLYYETSAKDRIAVKMDLRMVNPKTKVMRPGNPPRLTFECNSSDGDCIEIIPGGRVNRFRIGCDTNHIRKAWSHLSLERLYPHRTNFDSESFELEWNTERAANFLSSYKRVYLKGK